MFNLFVARVLFVIGNSKTTTNYNYNVVSRAPESSSTLGGGSLKRNEHNSPPFLHSNSVQSQRSNPSSQSDEIKFAKLMTVLSCSFVICWMPQMVSSDWDLFIWKLYIFIRKSSVHAMNECFEFCVELRPTLTINNFFARGLNIK